MIETSLVERRECEGFIKLRNLEIKVLHPVKKGNVISNNV